MENIKINSFSEIESVVDEEVKGLEHSASMGIGYNEMGYSLTYKDQSVNFAIVVTYALEGSDGFTYSYGETLEDYNEFLDFDESERTKFIEALVDYIIENLKG